MAQEGGVDLGGAKTGSNNAGWILTSDLDLPSITWATQICTHEIMGPDPSSPKGLAVHDTG